MSPDPLDHSVYPDMDEPPAVLETDEAKADYVHRICAAWDYGVIPTRKPSRSLPDGRRSSTASRC